MKQTERRSARLGAIVVASLLVTGAAAQPSITSLAPASAAAGATVVITGTGFAPGAAQSAVYFGTARATVTAASATQLTVQVPVGASSVAPVTVTDLSSQQAGSSLSSITPFFTVRFSGPGLNTASYQAANYPLATSRIGPAALATADFNADNYADFAVAADGVLLLLLSDGQGGYEPVLRLAAGAGPDYVKAADVDANGAADLLVSASGQLLLLRNLGNGNGFATATALNLDGQSLGSSIFTSTLFAVEVQDLTADGRPDLLTITTDGPQSANQRLVLLRNNGSGFDVPTVLLTDRIRGPLVADFNRDGRLDLLAVGQPNSAGVPTRLLMLARNAANTGYAAPEVTALGNISSNSIPQVADLNADGQADVVFSGQTNGTSGQLVGLRTTTGFIIQGPYGGTTSGANVPLLQAIADADGDGQPDAVTSGFTILRGQTGGSLAPPLAYSAAGASLITGDFNNDGRSDVATYDTQSGSLNIYRYTGASPNQNNAPTLNALSDLTLTEDDLQQTVALSGISNGGDAGQAVTLSAVSSDPSLIPNPTISYFSPTSTGTLRLRPTPDAFGTCTITVTASDGQTQNGTLNRTFQVTVGAVNDAPTLDALPDVVVTQMSTTVVVPLSGITSGAANENQLLTLTAAVSLASGGVGSNPPFIYTSPATTGEYRLSVSALTPGLYATVTLTVNDGQPSNNALSRTFRIFYQPSGGGQVNAPTLDPVADRTADRALTTQVPVALAGIADGDPNQVLPLTVTAVSSDPALVAVGPVSYTSPAATGSLPYTISAARGGTATVSVTVNNGLSPNGSITRSFRITVPQVLSAASRQPAATLHLYPNPAPAGRFWLESAAAGPADVTVTDLAGRVVWQRRLASLEQPQQLQLPSAAAGMYVVRVRTAAGTAVRRVMAE
ncbi:MAG: VCBS repeat-containing protein [Hymenobacter sp.]|nr:VCBS repeat-containing protein [Hymenobacter sp.]